MVSVVRELGFGGLYRGVGVTFARDACSAALFFSTYGWAKLWLEVHGLDEGFLQKLLAGLAAGERGDAPYYEKRERRPPPTPSLLFSSPPPSTLCNPLHTVMDGKGHGMGYYL